MTSVRRLWLLVVVALTIVGAPMGASAQSQGELSLARKFYQQGLKHEKAKQWQEALTSYDKALAIKSTPQLHLRAALCHENLGQLSKALVGYERSLEQAKLDQNQDAEALVRKRLVALRPRVPTLTFAVEKTYEGLTVSLDGEHLAASILGEPVPVDPGEHRIEATADGYKTWTKQVSLEEGAQLEVAIELSAARDAPPDGDPPDEPEPADGEPNYLPGGLLLGVGAAALGAGVAMFFVQRGIESDVDDLCGGPDRLTCPVESEADVTSDLDTAETLRITSFVVGGVGAAAVIAGIFLVILPPTSGPVSVAPGAAGADFGATVRVQL